jgi:hypothetical protein
VLSETHSYRTSAYDGKEENTEQAVLQRHFDAMSYLLTTTSPLQNLPGTDDTGIRQRPFDVWYKVVEQYSTRALTVLSDKLLAIPGIAQLMQEKFNFDYGAGLWKEDLLHGLCWTMQAASYTNDDYSHD